MNGSYNAHLCADPGRCAALAGMSGLVRGRSFTHFIALLALGLLDKGDRLIINHLLHVAFQILAQDSSGQHADSMYPLGHGWVGLASLAGGVNSPDARAGAFTAALVAPLGPGGNA